MWSELIWRKLMNGSGGGEQASVLHNGNVGQTFSGSSARDETHIQKLNHLI